MRFTPARTRLRRAAKAVLIGIAATVFVGAVLTPTPAAARPGTDVYVALGDSYAAASGVLNQSAGLCTRSDRNYPSVVAAALRPVTMRDMTCGGAVLKDLTEPQISQIGGIVINTPQIDAIGSDTTLVTLTIGGNDLGFADIVGRCAALSVHDMYGAPCAASFGSDLAERTVQLAPRVADTLRAIKTRAPGAQVLLVGYPATLPDDDAGCLGDQLIAVGDVAFVRSTMYDFAAMLAAQAAANGATYVDTYTPTIGHGICEPPAERWVEGLIPFQPAAPVHPNAAGERAMAAAVLTALGEVAPA
ncbi:SGNH/GDSL hydrolase family protein [Nocardia sp. NPDC005366]|uniref:SGNH/GDSL hydrolase family protein n=1 Tax=Nocardia sp. NPDC005366 TaxID=3156878 RepID=UPI0033AD9258